VRTCRTCYRYYCPSLSTVLQLSVLPVTLSTEFPSITITQTDIDVKTSSLRNGDESEKKRFFSPEGGMGLVPELGCLLTLAYEYYVFPRWYEFGERRWNDILTGENRRTRRKTCPSATLSTTNTTWIYPGANPGLRGVRPATNDLSHGKAEKKSYLHFLLQMISPRVSLRAISELCTVLPPNQGVPNSSECTRECL
jgi:hypothetical protein